MNYRKEDLSRMVSSLLILHDETAKFLNKHNLEPTLNSQADKELASFRKESVETAYSQGNLLIEASADHLIALHRSLTEPILTIAPFTSARAILESSALASWLFDPLIVVNERVKRSLSFRFEGLSQQVAFARAARKDISKAVERIDDVEKLAISLGFSTIQDKNGKRIGIAQQFPKMTSLIGSMFNEEYIYRLLSAFIHGHPWAIHQLSFNQIKNSYSSNNRFIFEKGLKPEALIFICHKSAYAFSKPIWNRNKLYGYNLSDFAKILNSIFDNSTFVKTSRFWNKP
ncbi:MAG: hypothetical protein WC330_03755 [Candidatus Omnitrophota bacterium]|jgi:hypothetical protein